MKRIYILGQAKGVYRTQNFIKFIVDRPNEYSISYTSFWSKSKVLRYLKSLFINPFTILKSNIVYVSTLNVDLDILWELFLSKIFMKRIIVDYYVSVYDTVVVDRQWFSPKSIMAKVALSIDKYFLKIATRVIFLNETEKSRYTANVNLDKKLKKFTIVPLCVEAMCEVESPFIKGTSDQLNVCWWGSYLPLHGLDRILEAINLLKEEGLPVHFYFFGNSEKKGIPFVEKAKALKVDDICTFRDDYSFKNGKLSKFLVNNCDVALGNFGSSEKSRNVLINKILDSCAMKAILLTCYSNAVSEYFDDKCDVYMTEIEPKDIADAIKRIYNEDKQKLKERTDKGYEIYQKEFSVEVYLKRIENVILKDL